MEKSNLHYKISTTLIKDVVTDYSLSSVLWKNQASTHITLGRCKGKKEDIWELSSVPGSDMQHFSTKISSNPRQQLPSEMPDQCERQYLGRGSPAEASP